MTKPTINELIKQQVEIEKQILAEIDKLPRSGMECNCDDRETYDTIHYGNWKEISSYCTNCGGYVDNEM